MAWYVLSFDQFLEKIAISSIQVASNCQISIHRRREIYRAVVGIAAGADVHPIVHTQCMKTKSQSTCRVWPSLYTWR